MKIRYPEDLDQLGSKDDEGYYLSLMTRDERLLLFTLVFTMKPKCLLEIGRSRGGSTLIMSNALDQNDVGGRLISIDPEFEVEHRMMDAHRQSVAHNVSFIVGPSPAAVAEAHAMAGEKFDFAFIDGDHSYEGCLGDLEGVAPYLADGACVILHDAHFALVKRAIATARQKDPRYVDCGMVSVRAPDSVDHGFLPDGEKIDWGGIQMLRFDAGAERTATPSGPGEVGSAADQPVARDEKLVKAQATLEGKQAKLSERQEALEKRLSRLEKRLADDTGTGSLRWALRHPRRFLLGK